jgi:hypothetical protein
MFPSSGGTHSVGLNTEVDSVSGAETERWIMFRIVMVIFTYHRHKHTDLLYALTYFLMLLVTYS